MPRPAATGIERGLGSRPAHLPEPFQSATRGLPASVDIEVQTEVAIAGQATGNGGCRREELVRVRRQPTHGIRRKRKQVDIYKDLSEDSSDEGALVRRQVRQQCKKQTLVASGGEVILEKLLEMQEELRKMINTYYKK